MSTRAADYLEAIEHLPEGATLVIHQAGWHDYESFDIEVQSYGSATWKRQKLAKGVEPDCRY